KMHDVTHYLHPDGTPFPAEECAGLQVLQKGVVLKEHEDVFIRKDGSFFPVVFSAAPLTVDGESVGIVVSFRDDTERRLAEEALRTSEARYRQLSEELEHRVDERTAELARTVAALHAEAAEREQAERASQAQTRALTRALAKLSREPRAEELPGIILAAIGEQFEVFGGSLWLYDEVTERGERMLDYEEGRILRADDPANPYPQKWFDNRKFPDWERLKTAFLRGECVVVTDFAPAPSLEPGQIRAYLDRGIRSALVVPVLLQGRLLGFYSLRSTRQENYGPRDLALAQALSHHATLAIQMARL